MRTLLVEASCNLCERLFSRDAFRLDSNGYIKERVCKNCLRLRARKIPMANGRRPDIYGEYKDTTCATCDFKGMPCQLDVDHIDGDFNNNNSDNLQTLCANCHRLKTYLQK